MKHRRQDKTAKLRQLRRLVLLVGLGGCGQAGVQAPVAPVMTDLAAQDLAALVKATGLETQASGDGHAAQLVAAVPSKPRSREYVGSEVCRSCHKAKHQAWSQDWHQRALTPATGKFVVGNFSGAHFAGTSSEATMFRRGGQPLMRTVSEAGVQTDFPVSYVIGGKRMQDSVTVLPSGFWQVLPVYYHVTPHGKEQAAWVDYNETKQGHIGPEHPFFWTNFRRNVNHECLDCHTTGLKVAMKPGAVPPGTPRMTTTFADAGVACESCHGPGAVHAKSEEAEDIVQPGKLAPAEALAVCAQCHGPRNPLFPVLDAKHHFLPGERYDDSYAALVVVSGTSRSGEYFGDGRPKSSSFEYQALVQSQCFLKSKDLTCLTCHSAPHDPSGASELRAEPGKKGSRSTASQAATSDRAPAAARKDLTVDVNASCLHCHPAIAAARASHAQHQSAAAQSCVACHMPKVVTGVLDEFADHAIDVPAPGNTARHGIPSACGVCHKDRSATQLSQDLLARWPQASKRQQRRLRLADAIDETTAADSLAALRAVVGDPHEAAILRGAAALLLGQRFAAVAPAALLPLLKEADPLLRTKAIEGLGYAKALGASSEIAQHLDDPALSVRQIAAVVLTALGDARGEPALRKLAHDEKSAGLVHPHYLLGVLATRRGDFRTAQGELEQAVTLMPYFVDALVALGDVLLRTQKLELATERFNEVLAYDRHHKGAQQRLLQLSSLTAGKQ